MIEIIHGIARQIRQLRAASRWSQRGVLRGCAAAFLVLTSAIAAAQSVTWTKIADEGRSFTVTGTQRVRYGANSSWIEKTVSGTGQCTNDYFGRDPLFNVVKQCQLASTTAPPTPVALSWSAPASNTTLSGTAAFQLTGQAFQNVEIFHDGQMIARANVSADRTTARADIDTKRFSNGTVTLTAHAWNSPPGTPFTSEADAGGRQFVVDNAVAPPIPGGAGSWMSGACFIKDDAFANWRGEPTLITSFWSDTDKHIQTSIWGITQYPNWSESMDIAVGMLVANSGETMAQAGNGAYDGRWRTAMQNIRANWGAKKTIFIRPAHEMNGHWYPWSVSTSNLNDFKRAWIRYYNIIQQELVAYGYDAKVVFNVGKDSTNGVGVDRIWPGDQYVDVLGVDFYDMYPSYFTQAQWDADYNSQDDVGGPRGINAFREFALAHGKPMAFPEWGTHPHFVQDNPFFIEKMNEFFRRHAGSGPGQVLYEIYFNTWNEVQIHPTTNVPNSAAKYRSLVWGKTSN